MKPWRFSTTGIRTTNLMSLMTTPEIALVMDAVPSVFLWGSHPANSAVQCGHRSLLSTTNIPYYTFWAQRWRGRDLCTLLNIKRTVRGPDWERQMENFNWTSRETPLPHMISEESGSDSGSELDTYTHSVWSSAYTFAQMALAFFKRVRGMTSQSGKYMVAHYMQGMSHSQP